MKGCVLDFTEFFLFFSRKLCFRTPKLVQLRVQGQAYSYEEIQANMDLVKKMSESEKADYTAYVANLYADQY